MDSYKLSRMGAFSVNATRYVAVSAGTDTIAQSTESLVEGYVASAGTFKNLFIEVDGAPGAGESFTVTLRKNNLDTAIVVTISDTATTGSDTSNTVTVAAGDLISYKLTTSVTAAAGKSPRMSIDYTGDTANESLLLGALVITASDCFTGVDGVTGFDASTHDDGKQLVATAGTISKLYIRLSTAPTGAETNTFTVYKNGSATALTLTISGAATTGSDLSNSFAVVAGDSLSIQKDESAGAINASFIWGMVFAATTDGEFPILAGTTAEPSTTVTNYTQMNNSGAATESTEFATLMCCGRTSWITNLYAAVTTAPGAGNSYTFTLRNTTVNTALSVLINEANTTGNDSSATGVAIANFDNLTLSLVPVSTPTAPETISWGFTATMTEPPQAAASRRVIIAS